MKLDKAIEVLEELARKWSHDYDDEDLQAVKLGIEALKFLRWAREQGQILWDDTLPGETEEEK